MFQSCGTQSTINLSDTITESAIVLRSALNFIYHGTLDISDDAVGLHVVISAHAFMVKYEMTTTIQHFVRYILEYLSLEPSRGHIVFVLGAGVGSPKICTRAIRVGGGYTWTLEGDTSAPDSFVMSAPTFDLSSIRYDYFALIPSFYAHPLLRAMKTKYYGDGLKDWDTVADTFELLVKKHSGAFAKAQIYIADCSRLIRWHSSQTVALVAMEIAEMPNCRRRCSVVA